MNKLLLLGAFALVALVGCGGGNATATKTLPPDTLRLITINNPATLDPAFSQDNPTNELMSQIYEGLVAFDERNRVVPRLAEKWTISPDGRTYLFQLKPGVKFSNGQPFSAADVKASIERLANPDLGSPLAMGYLGDIEGFQARRGGKASEVKGVQVKGEMEVAISLDKARPYFLGKLTYPVAFMVPKGTAKIESVGQMVGTGPFVVKEFVPNQEIRLQANATYHLGAPKIGKLAYRVVKDPATAVLLYRNQEIDILAINPNDTETFRKDPKLNAQLIYADQPSINYIGMNGKNYAPFANPKVRRAFVMAVDRERIVKSLLNGIGKPAVGILPEMIPQKSRTKPIPPFDVAGAKKLLAESGVKEFPPLELWVSESNRDRKRIAEFVAGQITENLAVPVKLRQAENTLIIDRATKRQLPFFYGNWFADYLDAENFLSVLLADYGQNRTSYDNPEFSRLTQRADQEPNEQKRQELYAQAEDLALQDAPWIPLFHPQDVIAIHPRVSGAKRNLFGFLPYREVSLAKVP
jgi:oligopeptide transport system substrate-binding protein